MKEHTWPSIITVLSQDPARRVVVALLDGEWTECSYEFMEEALRH